MKKHVLTGAFMLMIFLFFSKAALPQISSKLIDSLNARADEARNTSRQKSINIVYQSVKLSERIEYRSGTAEAYRILGAIFQNTGERDSALKCYSKSYALFKQDNNRSGIAKTLNNIGNFYLDFNTDQALYYYQLALERGKSTDYNLLEAGCYMNIGILYKKKKEFKKALENYEEALLQFQYLKNYKGIVQALVNIGNVHLKTKNYSKAKEAFEEARDIAKENQLLFLLIKINNTLSEIYIQENNFKRAQFLLNETKDLVKDMDNDLYYDYILNYYHLEKARKNYKSALSYLERVNRKDSIYFEESTDKIYRLVEENQKNVQKQKQYELSLEREKHNQIILIAIIIVTFLFSILILILVRSKRKAEKSNYKLIELNKEISKQKEDLNQINAKLEETIEERTKDLVLKNQKLSEFSSHLSHRIRGPVVTIKGLLMLAQEGLISDEECLGRIKECVHDMDEHIVDINSVLHDHTKGSFGKEDPESGNL